MKRTVFTSLTTLVLVFSTLAVPPVAAQSDETREHRSTLTDQQEVAVTIYNQDLALVKDLRIIKLDKGFNKLAMQIGRASCRERV